jgi:hypothetical protein
MGLVNKALDGFVEWVDAKAEYATEAKINARKELLS